MITLSIPGIKNNMVLKHLVLDYNGTLATDGNISDPIIKLIETLSKKIKVHVITADTFGCAQQKLNGLPVEITILTSKNQAKAKLNYIKKFNRNHVVSIGNGNNDHLMLKKSLLSIAVMGREGLSNKAMFSADIICNDIIDALEMLINPLRIIATLRN